ncbi:MAG: sulfurtransferase TusA family protein [Symbiobacterium sp.]|uniref:sulfurtransferase TusA family protein n=1 Tax=Symbiobacterium sp. TaxID=1971213 RepID=UPI0034649B13
MVKELVVDVLGEPCPYPLVIAKQKINLVEPGGRLVIDFDCNQATESLPRWATGAGHVIESFAKTGPAQWRIVIRKRGDAPERITPEDYSCTIPSER